MLRAQDGYAGAAQCLRRRGALPIRHARAARDRSRRRRVLERLCSGVLRTGNLNGTGASDLSTGAQEPQGIALDPGSGMVYWAEAATGRIEVGNLNGTGTPQTLYTEPAGARPTDVAIDAAAGKLYWTDEGSGAIKVGSTRGRGTPSTLYSDPGAAHPHGYRDRLGGGQALLDGRRQRRNPRRRAGRRRGEDALQGARRLAPERHRDGVLDEQALLDRRG